MHSLEPEIRELLRARLIDDATAAAAVARESGTSFSVYRELRLAMYAGVAAVTAGLGMVLKRNLDRIGPATLLLALGVAATLCYVYAIRGRRSAGTEYVLLLGALLASAALGYGESQYHWLGGDWSRHLLLLAVLHAATAYAFRSPLVLSLSLSALAGWIGVERSFGSLLTVDRIGAAAGTRAFACAGLVFAWRAAHHHFKGAPPLREVLEHFGVNLGFWGGLAWCVNADRRGAGVLLVLALAAVTIRIGLRGAREIFVIYGVVYAAAALLIVEARLTTAPLLEALAMLCTVSGAAGLLWWLHDSLARPAP